VLLLFYQLYQSLEFWICLLLAMGISASFYFFQLFQSLKL
jgi:hypothetical protein